MIVYPVLIALLLGIVLLALVMRWELRDKRKRGE